VAGVGYGAAQSLTLVSAFARTGAHARATASAVWNVAFDAGTAVGAVLIGALTATSLGIWGSFAVLAALAVGVVPLAFASARP
jgi:predicted MFS family arabinose efflux permease